MGRVLGIAQIQLRLDPLIVRQLQLPGRIQLDALQVLDERFGNLGEQRCLAAIVGIEISHSRMPALFAQRLAHHRKTAGQQTFDSTIEQLAVNLQPPGLYARRRRMALRVTQVPGQGVLLLTQGLIHLHALPKHAAQC